MIKRKIQLKKNIIGNFKTLEYFKNFIYDEKKLSQDSIKLILQVHDELILEVREDLVSMIAVKLKEIMENVHLRHSEHAKDRFKAPIAVEVGVGENWGECK